MERIVQAYNRGTLYYNSKGYYLNTNQAKSTPWPDDMRPLAGYNGRLTLPWCRGENGWYLSEKEFARTRKCRDSVHRAAVASKERRISYDIFDDTSFEEEVVDDEDDEHKRLPPLEIEETPVPLYEAAMACSRRRHRFAKGIAKMKERQPHQDVPRWSRLQAAQASVMRTAQAGGTTSQ